MNKERERKKILGKLSKIAFEKPNDAVKLAFLKDENSAEEIEKLDLTMLSEVKRDKNGAVEVKLVNRLEVVKMIFDELREESDGQGAEMFLRALNDTE